MTRNLSFPFRIGDHGRPAVVERRQVIREQLEQLLFTLPGERVNRPDFGCGVQRLVFEGATVETAAATEYLVGVAVRKHLATQLRLDAVRVTTDDVTLYVDILYTRLETAEEEAETFARPLQAAP